MKAVDYRTTVLFACGQLEKDTYYLLDWAIFYGKVVCPMKPNCDGLGIGLQMKALHHREWSQLDWNKEYAQIKIQPHIRVKIKNHGLLISWLAATAASSKVNFNNSD
ncbi:Ger(x)C family spore germination C-terminal domain-containing protein [Paenibacillus lignilyticus]|nr:Ger(x)C family spore germination C-terminal domain-containing protein [Paenibacillus lignilyticus]